jgi:hypothetical protein
MIVYQKKNDMFNVCILPISIYLVVVLYRHKHCRPQKVELDLACRDSTTTKNLKDPSTFSIH